MGLFGLYAWAKRWIQQLVLGHQLLKAPSTRSTLSTVEDFEDALDLLLGKYVDGQGQVNYEALLQGEGASQLGQIVRFIADSSPAAQPHIYNTTEKQLAYYCNAYNALVLWGVVQKWPLSSVRECKVWVGFRYTTL